MGSKRLSGEKIMRVVLCTAPEEQAEKIAEAILEAKLAACINLTGKVKSKYWWEGKIQTDEEILLIIKTRQELMEPLIKKIKEVHPYQVPEIISLEIKEGSSDYLNWILASTI